MPTALYVDIFRKMTTCRSDSYVYSFTALVGSICIFIILLKVLTALRKFFLRESYHLPKRYGTGTWALITAPTSASGHGFAVELAKLAFNIILVGRNIEKLNKMRDLLILRHNVKVINNELRFAVSQKKNIVACSSWRWCNVERSIPNASVR